MEALKKLANALKPKSYGFYMHAEYLAFRYPESKQVKNLSYRWIRAQCCCPKCRDVDSGIKYRIGNIASKETFEVKSCYLLDDFVEFNWADKHTSKVPLSLLKYGTTTAYTSTGPLDIKTFLRRNSASLWNEFTPRNETFVDTLGNNNTNMDDMQDSLFASTVNQSLEKYGIARVTNLPIERPEESIRLIVGMLKTPAKIFKDQFIHTIHSETKEELAVFDRSFRETPFHTEYVYFPGEAPEISIMLCVENEMPGGELEFVDGYYAIQKLASTDMTLLANNNVLFKFQNICSYKPIVTINEGGMSISYSPSFMEGPMIADYKEMDKHYRALECFENALEIPSIQFRQQMKPGDLIIWNNRRVLSRRRAIQPIQGRRYFVSANAAHIQHQ